MTGGGKLKSATYRPGQPTKKKTPLGAMPRGDEICFETTKKRVVSDAPWIYVFLPNAMTPLPDSAKSNRRNNKGQPKTYNFKPSPPHEVASQDSPFYFHWGYQFCVESFSKHGSCASDA